MRINLTKLSFCIFAFLFSSIVANAAPTITSITPLSAKPGDVVTIVGTNFSGTIARTEVYFGNTKVTAYTSASTTTLRVIVPIGATYGPITVLDKVNNRYGHSRQFFSPIYSPQKGSFDAGDMTTSSIFSSGTNPYNVAVGDIDGDGKSDAVVVNYSANTVSVLRNTSTVGNINFASKVDFATGSNPYSVAIADIDNDTLLDIIVVNNGASTISILKNTSTSGVISFAAKVDQATGLSGSGSTGIAVADLDGDGWQDVLVCNGGNNKVSVLVNTSSTTPISFANKVEFTTGTTPRGIAIADIDGDARLDIIATNSGASSISIIRNTSVFGTLTLAAKVDFSVGLNPVSVAVGDIDADGKLDVIVSNYNAGNVSTLRNTSVSGTITLATAVNKTTTPFAETVSITDIDADGKLDVVNANNASSLAVLKNTTTATSPTYALAVTFSTGSLTYAHAMGDIDGDGKIDAVVVTNLNNGIVVVRNAPVFSSNANLSALTTTAGAISPTFSSSVTSYTASVSNATTSITVTPTKQQDSAKIQIQLNGGTYTSIASGSPSSALTLVLGVNTINIRVTAQDGTTIKIYTLTVNRVGAPTITSISPTSGAVGTTVTIAGTFFNSTPANNVVFFGAAKATVTAATTTSLTVTVPTGATYAPITILNTASVLTASSKQYFNTTYKPNKGSITNIDMTASANFTVNSDPQQVAIGDIDGDGKLDVVVVDYGNSKVSVLRNTSTTGTVSFATKVDFTTTTRPYSVALADMNNDGKLDIITADFLSATVSVFRNTSTNGVVSFATRVDKSSGIALATHQFLAVADIDGDGKLDVVVANGGTNDISVLRNTSTTTIISFATFITFSTVNGPSGIAVGDVDNDGKPDVVVSGETNLINGKVSILRNTSISGSISFATKSDYTVGGGSSFLSLGDMNGDGLNDIITGNITNNSVSVLINYSIAGTLFIDPVKNFATGTNGSVVSIADIDGDGKLDIAVAGNAGGGVIVLRNTTTATWNLSFASYIVFASAPSSQGVACADIDGDGKVDITAVSYLSPNLVVLRNTPVLSTNANLSSLAISTGVLSPVFDSLTLAYTTNVSPSTTTMTVTPNVVDTNATLQVRINGGVYANVIRGTASSALSLSLTVNTIDVKVTAQDGTTIKTYTITVTKIPIPNITSFTPNSGPVGTLVTIIGTNLSNPTTLNIGGVAAVPISNTGTAIVAMVMPGATTGSVYITTIGGIVNFGFFTVTPTQFPSVQQGNKLVGTGILGTPQFGEAIALSADGNIAIIGGHRDSNYVGAAWVYTRTNGVWTQQGKKLVGIGGVGQSYQGSSVALSADGNTAIIGGWADNSYVGAAWVFTRSGSTWTQQGSKLVGSYSGSSDQGFSVALSADGNTAAVGGDGNAASKGAVWIYARSGSTWAFQTRVTGNDVIGFSTQIGKSVALSADGNTLITGGIGDNTNVGASWVFTRSGSTWTQQGNKLVGTGYVGESYQGKSVALSADGNTAVIGGYYDNNFVGAAWVFTRSGSTWTQQGNKLVANNSIGNAFQGQSVAVSADGNTAMVGSGFDNNFIGATWIYTRTGGIWTQKSNKLIGSNAIGSAFQGFGVAISSNATTGFVGGIGDDGGIGAAWAYTLSGNANLANLSISNGILSPVFDSATEVYDAGQVSYLISQVTITPTKADSNATIQVNVNGSSYASINSGMASPYLILNVGNNLISIRVTAQDGTIKNYSISINRRCGVTSSQTVSVCPSDLPYTWNGLVFTSAGSQTYYTNSSTSCDSTATLNLTINKSTTSWTDVVTCDSTLWNGVWYSKSGFYTIHLTNKAGCDSAASLNLTVNDKPTGSFSSTNGDICAGDSSYISFDVPFTKNRQYLHIYAPIDTTFEMGTASFGADTRTIPLSANSIAYLPNSSPSNQACATTFATNVFDGKVALIDRGNCTFAAKAKAVQDAGAIGIIIVNNVAGGGANGMSGSDPTITIPVISVSQEDGQIIKNWLNAGTNVVPYSVVHTPTYLWSTGSTSNTIKAKPTQTTIYNVTVSYENGCSQIFYYALVVRKNSTSTTTLSACDSIVWNGVTYKTSGQYVYHTLNKAGCDSAATLNLTIKKTTSSNVVTLCSSQFPYVWNGLTFTGAGSQTAHLINAAGCDSAATLYLVLNEYDVPNFTISSSKGLRICSGDSTTLTVNGISNTKGRITFTIGGTTYTDSITASSLGNPYLYSIFGANISATSTTLIATDACSPLPTGSLNGRIAFIRRGTCLPAAKVINAKNAGAIGVIIYNNTGGNVAYTPGGLDTAITFPVFGMSQSDGEALLTLLNANNNTISSTVFAPKTYFTISNGFADLNSPITINTGKITKDTTISISVYGQSGQVTGANNIGYYVTNNCGNTQSILIKVAHPSSSVNNRSICNGDSLLFNGTYYKTAGTYNSKLTNSLGCDSTVILNLTVLTPLKTTVNHKICETALPFTINGLTFNEAGSQTQKITSSNGCDSFVTHILSTVSDGIFDFATITQPQCDSVFGSINVNHYTISRKYKSTIDSLDKTQIGLLDINNLQSTSCGDPVVVPNLVTNDSRPRFYESYKFRNTSNQAKCFGFGLTNYNGIHALRVVAYLDSFVASNPRTNFLANMQKISGSGNQYANVTVPAGRDVEFVVSNFNNGASYGDYIFEVSGFEPMEYSIDSGSTWQTSKTFKVSQGKYNIAMRTGDTYCTRFYYDNPVLINSKKSTSSTTNLSICPNALPYSWNGLTFATTGTKTKTGLINSQGCDSSATLNLTVKTNTSSNNNLSICPSALPYSWNGLIFTVAGSKTKTGLLNSQGCDSSASLNLTIKTITSSTTNLSICPIALPYSWNGLTFSSAGSQTKTGLTNSQGCDSSATLNLAVNPLPNAGVISGNNSFCFIGGSTTLTSNGDAGGVWTSSNSARVSVTIGGKVTASMGGNYIIYYTVTNSCSTSVASFNIKVNVPSSTTISLSACNSYTWGGTTYNSSGIYTKTGMTNVSGCDSSATLDLTINPLPIITNVIANPNAICLGNSSALNVTGNGGLVTSGSPTDMWFNSPITFNNSSNVMVPNNVEFTRIPITNASTINSLWVELWQNAPAGVTLKMAIYTNDPTTNRPSTLIQETNQVNNASGNILVSGRNQINLNPSLILQPGIYWIAAHWQGGNMPIKQFTGSATTSYYTARNYSLGFPTAVASAQLTSEGFVVGIGLRATTMTNTTATYSWSPSSTLSSSTGASVIATPSSTRTYTVTAKNGYNCTVSTPITITVNNPTSSTQSLSICPSQLPYSWNSLTFTVAGSQTKTGLINSQGCDSSATLNLTTTLALNTTTTTTAYGSYKWLKNNTTYTTTGTYTTGFTNATGCAVVDTLKLIINPYTGCFKQVSAGAFHNIAIKTDGTLWAWGYNAFGELGDGTVIDKITPIQIGTDNNWASISAGGYHTTAIKTDGTLWAWGNNSNGELGDGTTANKNNPTKIGVATNWASISAGENHTTAIKTDGTLWAWGLNEDGQLGDFTYMDKITPIQIGTSNNWASISAGGFHTTAIKTDGTLWAWGANSNGQLGDSTLITKYNPTKIGTASNWATIRAGYSHTTAIKTDGTLWAWGANLGGQLGDGTTSRKTTPALIGTANNWASITTGYSHTTAIKTDGTLWAWGTNFYGLLGDGTNIDKYIPTQIGTSNNWGSIAAGSYNTTAVKTDGSLWAWGYNLYGQLGDGTKINKNTPTSIACPTACTPTSSTFTVAACNSYTWVAKGNKVYTANNNTDTIKLINTAGCDSIVTLNLTIKTNTTSTQNLSICPSQLPFSWNGLIFTAAGSQTKTGLTNSQGCDSSATLNLTVKTNTSSTTNLSICPSALPYSWNGLTFTAAGSQTKTGLVNSQGCDSAATLNLTVKTNTNSTNNLSICPSALPYSWNGLTFTAAGSQTKTGLVNSQGCDSSATLSLTIKSVIYDTINKTICSGQIYLGHTATGTYTDTLVNSQGCDSVRTLNLTITASVTPTISIATTSVNVCKGYVVVYNAALSNEGINPLYQWYKNGTIVGTNSNIYKDSLLNNQDSIWCVLTSSEACVTANNIKSNIIKMSVSLAITGAFKTPTGIAINKVALYRKGSINDMQMVNSKYNSSCINLANSIGLYPTKNNDINKANGLTSVDVLLTQRHILNTTKLNSPYKLIAADVDGNKAINSVDILRMKRLILGTDTTFTSTTKGNRLWEFVDSAYQFPDTTNPFPFKDSISFTNLTSNKTNQTFIGVKLGDVNYDWNAAVAKSLATNAVEFVYSIRNEEFGIRNSVVRIPITVKNFNQLVAMQYTLHFDNRNYEFVGIENNKLSIDFNERQALLNGNISFLWTDKNAVEKTLEDGTELFTLVLRSTVDGRLSTDLTLTSDITEIAAWDKEYSQKNITLSKSEIKNNQQVPKNEWLSLGPNPTSGLVRVNILSKLNKTISFELTDAQGKLILNQSVELQKGNNIIALNLKKNCNLATGIYLLKAIGLGDENSRRIIVK